MSYHRCNPFLSLPGIGLSPPRPSLPLPPRPSCCPTRQLLHRTIQPVDLRLQVLNVSIQDTLELATLFNLVVKLKRDWSETPYGKTTTHLKPLLIPLIYPVVMLPHRTLEQLSNIANEESDFLRSRMKVVKSRPSIKEVLERQGIGARGFRIMDPFRNCWRGFPRRHGSRVDRAFRRRDIDWGFS